MQSHDLDKVETHETPKALHFQLLESIDMPPYTTNPNPLLGKRLQKVGASFLFDHCTRECHLQGETSGKENQVTYYKTQTLPLYIDQCLHTYMSWNIIYATVSNEGHYVGEDGFLQRLYKEALRDFFMDYDFDSGNHFLL